jgi:hypothetical protein
LVIHANAVATCVIALQQFKPIPCRDRQIVEASGRVDQSQFALNPAPKIPGDPSRRSSVSFEKQIHGGGIGERLNHTVLHITRVACNPSNLSVEPITARPFTAERE